MGNRNSGVNRRQEMEDLTDYVNNGWLHSGEFDGPTFLWNRLIREASHEDERNRNNVPVAPLTDADNVISMPMQWYFDSIASIVPTAERNEAGVEIPRIDMPTFRIESQALSGVDAVVGNAIISTRWLDAVANLAKAVEMTARFVGNVADRDNEGFDYLKDLIQTIRVYMDAVACNADPATGEQALRMITHVACNEDFRLNAMQMIELLSCGLSFAQWDDTRMFAYDALNNAIATMNDFADKNALEGKKAEQGPSNAKADRTGSASSDSPSDSPSGEAASIDDVKLDSSLFDLGDSLSSEELSNLAMIDSALLSEKEIALTAHDQFDHAVMFLRHDLMRISGDTDEADRFLRNNHTCEPLADAYAARLIASERWHDLINFVNLVQRDKPNQTTVMFPEEVVPYEWETIREAALEALERGDELAAMYQERLQDTYDPNVELNHMKLEAWMDEL
jgi:hypothetical protein